MNADTANDSVNRVATVMNKPKTGTELRRSKKHMLPWVLALLWGLKLVGGIAFEGYSSTVHLRALYAGLAAELLLSVVAGSALEDVAGTIDSTNPSLTSWFEVSAMMTSQAARVVFERIIDASNAAHIWLTWAGVCLVAWLGGITGSRLTLKGDTSTSTSGRLVAALVLGVSWACANSVPDAIWNVAKKREALLDLRIDFVTFHVATFRFVAAMILFGIKTKFQHGFMPEVRWSVAGLLGLVTLVAAQVTPVVMYAAALAFNHRGFDGYLGLAFAMRIALDSGLEMFVPKLGSSRAFGYAMCAAGLSALAFAALNLAPYGGDGGTSLRVASIIVAIVIDRCSDATAHHMGGQALRYAQKPLFALAIYWLKATYDITALRAHMKTEPNAVVDVLCQHFAGVTATWAWGITCALWLSLSVHFWRHAKTENIKKQA